LGGVDVIAAGGSKTGVGAGRGLGLAFAPPTLTVKPGVRTVVA
jgi:hypothetical protein